MGDNTIQSAANANLYLPKLNAVKHKECNLQVFIRCGWIDRKEIKSLEDYLNRIASNFPVSCFGALEDYCNASFLENLTLVKLPKVINASYSNVDISSTQEVDLAWEKTNEKNRSSSQQAANHVWVKIRNMWSHIEHKYDKSSFEPDSNLISILQDHTFKYEFGECKHRRWCAEMLLRGFTPLTEEYDSEEYKNNSSNWGKSEFRDEKNKILSQQKHIDLIPFDVLHSVEAAKDLKQLAKFTAFMRTILEGH